MLEARYRVVSLTTQYGTINMALLEEIDPIILSAVGPSGCTTPSLKVVDMQPAGDHNILGPEIIVDPEAEEKALKSTMPVPETEEEKIIYRMFTAVKKFIPGFDPTKPGMGLEQTFPMRSTRPPKILTFQLSPEQYKALGRPHINQIIMLQITTAPIIKPCAHATPDVILPIDIEILNTTCPKCGSMETEQYAKSAVGPKFLCKNCENTFHTNLLKKENAEV